MGNRRLPALLTIFLYCLLSAVPHANAAARPKALYYGFSQSGQGFCGLGGISIEKILQEGRCPEPATVDAMDIIAVTKGGAAIEFWKNPDYSGYDYNQFHLPKPSALVITRPEANILIINISGSARTIDEWDEEIDKAVGTMQDLHENVEKIYLQPVGTGPLDSNGQPVQCMKEGQVVRAISNHPDIMAAITRVVGRHDMVELGLVARVSTCDYFADKGGHYNDNGGAAEVRQQIHDFYSGLAGPADTVAPQPPGDFRLDE